MRLLCENVSSQKLVRKGKGVTFLMDNNKNSNKDYYVIDIMHIVRTVWYRIWIVAIVGIISACISFLTVTFAIVPTYSSSIMLYVNNSSISLKDVGFSISSSDISAAQSLVKTYNVLLKNRTTLEMVIEKTKVSYSWKELYDMIEASSVNDTEVMRVTVTSNDPYEAKKIANGIAEILPQRVTEIVEGTSMEVVDSAVANLSKVAPSITKYTAVGFIMGAFVTIIILVIKAIMDNTIHDEDYVVQNYDYPILAKVPDLIDSGNKKYGYNYYQSKKVSK